MARKTKAEAEQTRQDIFNAALELFHDRGFSRTTLDQIARKAGVTRGAIYWHFKDKVDLFVGLKDEVEGSAGMRLEDFLQISVDSLADMQEGLLSFFRSLEENLRFRTYLRTVLFRTEFTDDLQPLMEQYQHRLRLRQQKDEDDLRRLQKAGKVRADVDCIQAALAVRVLMIGLLHTWLMDSDIFSIAEQGGALTGEYFASLRADG
ncbi:MAG: hypothetical protein BA870_03475 [Desulfuromonadales bacterium C00003094]|nr:MAG: hypothetical protein BA870_03475 [Desulfuromonadales bacterium C00003094]OEU77813.1 MAG: hypothetical protein BA869_10925 [Desulfuromonadales bacterium C00003107]